MTVTTRSRNAAEETADDIDPRLAERRAAVERDEGRAKRRRLVVLAALLAVPLALWWIVQSPLVDVDRVEVHGLDRVGRSAAVDALAIPEGAPMFFVDEQAAADRIEALPWVATADVRRSWPGSIVIDITERSPIAIALAAPDSWVMVDADGRVLSEAVVPPPPLPRLSGLRGAGAPGDHLADDAEAPLAVVAALEVSLGHQQFDLLLGEAIRGIYRDQRGELRVLFSASEMTPGGGEFIIGDDDALRAKVAAMRTMLELMSSEGREGWLIDVSVPNLPVVVDPTAEPGRANEHRAAPSLVNDHPAAEPHASNDSADGAGAPNTAEDESAPSPQQ